MIGLQNIGNIDFHGKTLSVDTIKGFSGNLEIAVSIKNDAGDIEEVILSGLLKLSKTNKGIQFIPDISKRKNMDMDADEGDGALESESKLGTSNKDDSDQNVREEITSNSIV